MTRQLRTFSAGPVIVIDKDEVATEEELSSVGVGPESIHRVTDWFGLRKVWEHEIRTSTAGGHAGVVVVCDPAVATEDDLPFDIAGASTVLRIRTPGSLPVSQILRSLEPEISDSVAARIANTSIPHSDALLSVLGDLPPLLLDETTGPEQFRIAVRLLAHTWPDAATALAREVLTDPLAAAVVAQPPGVEALQGAWADWASKGPGSRWNRHFSNAASDISSLFLSGLLKPVRSERSDIPTWAALGLSIETPVERLTALLDTPPPISDSSTFDDWVQAAQWWGQIRSDLALTNPCPPSTSEAAWAAWSLLDEAFQPWLRANYGSQLTRSWLSGPISLNKVQPFMSTRRSESGRVLVIVIDGMAFAQWTRIRERSTFRILQASGSLAMLPTITEISRQAIAAGELPNQFPESLDTTTKEPQRWQAAWADTVPDATWMRIDGVNPAELERVPFGSSRAIGVVISAIDKLMHSAGLLGDVGLHASVDVWLDSGVLDQLVREASTNGFDIWITADHGNMECIPSSARQEGDYVANAGTRWRRYKNRTLRDQAKMEGDRWDTIPGLPQDQAERILFPTGRTGWGPSRVSHGGLSLDEVIVPFVQVAAS